MADMADNYGPIESGVSRITPTGEIKINCRRAPEEMRRRFPNATPELIEKLTRIAQGDPVFTRIALDAEGDDPLAAIESRVSAFADWTGAEHEDRACFRFVGYACNTAFLQGNGDLIDGDFAASSGGGMTVNNTGSGDIPSGHAYLYWPPYSPNLNNDFGKMGRRLAESVAYDPLKHNLRDQALYEKIQAMRTGMVDLPAQPKSIQKLYTAAMSVWKSQKAQAYSSALLALESDKGDLTAAEKQDWAEMYGVVPARAGSDKEKRQQRNTAFQNRLINTLYSRKLVGAAGVSAPDESYTPFPSVVDGRHNPNMDQITINGAVLSAPSLIVDSLNTVWNEVHATVVGWASRGSKPQQDLDTRML